MNLELEATLAALSAEEIIAALRLATAPARVRSIVRGAFEVVSRPLGRALARFDARVDSLGLSAAASAALDDLGATWSRSGALPAPRGPLVVVSNHPGAYDALVLLAAIGRDDVGVIAADRTFLRAMPSLSRHLIFVPEAASMAMGRARALRRARAHLAGGGALVQFGAGRIEPDPSFALPYGMERLAPWHAGTGRLVRVARVLRGGRGAAVVVALVEGVHSIRAKRSWISRAAERRGVTTVAPLLQVALPYYRAVAARVRFADVRAEDVARPTDTEMAEALRTRALALWPAPRGDEHSPKCGDGIDPSR